jgi:hypothetical protein
MSMILTDGGNPYANTPRAARDGQHRPTQGLHWVMVFFRSVAGTIGLLALGLQFWLMTRYPDARSLSTTITKYFSYFTILTNTLMVLSMFVPLIARKSAAGRSLSRPSIRTVIAGYSLIVAIVYFLFLRNIGNDRDLEFVADQLLHYVTPAMFAFDWLVFVRRGEIPWSTIAASLILPALYGLWTLIHGALTGWYPYPFFNAARIGYPRTLVNFALFGVVFVIASLVLILLDRSILSLSRRGKPT